MKRSNGGNVKRVPDSEIDYPGDGYYYHDGQRFTGVEYFLNEEEGWVEAETEYVEGLPSGLKREWAGPDKQLLYEGEFRGGVLHGRKRRWTEDGTLIEDGEYEYGIPLWEKWWDEDGDLVREYELSETDGNYTLLQEYRQMEREQAAKRES